MNYETLLGNAPDHDTPEFLAYLREHNPVVWENPQWLIIENAKYDGWLTAFWKGQNRSGGKAWWVDLDILWYEFGDYEWRKKAVDKQSVRRFHIHLIPPEK